MDTRPIGIFDSGFGGLTVVEQLATQLPNERLIYLGDTLRAPYGTKPENEVIEYATETTQWLKRREVKAVIVACNTTSSVALPMLKASTEVPVFGMIDACVDTVLSWEVLTGVDIQKLAIIASRNTVNTRAHENRFRTEGFTGKIYPVECSLFNQILAESIMDETIWKATINYYLSRIRDEGIDGLLIAHTVFPLISEYLHEYFGGGVQIFNPNYMVIKRVTEYLEENDLLNTTPSDNESRPSLNVTGSLATFETFYKRFFHFEANNISVVNVSE